jgi:hypothetical protein
MNFKLKRLTTRVRMAAGGLSLQPGCFWQEQDANPPAKPVLLGPVPDTSLTENGIDAVPEGSWIQLQWLANTESDLARYEIFRFEYDDQADKKLSPDSVIAVLTVGDANGDTITWMDKSVAEDIRYYYYLRAYDDDNNISEQSHIVDFKLINKVNPTKMLAPRGQIFNIRPEFKVGNLSADISITAFVIKVFDVNLQRVVWASAIIDPFNHSTVYYNQGGTVLAGHESLTIDRIYRWRVDAIGTGEHAGSESKWVEFEVVSN